MSDGYQDWDRVSKDHPCPICGKPDNCCVSSDGVMAWCGRISIGSIKQNAGGQFLHRLKESNRDHQNSNRGWTTTPTKPELTRARNKPSSSDEKIANFVPNRYQLRALASYRFGAEERIVLAKLLGVSADALARLRVGWHAPECTWDFPERDAKGNVIGINRRSRDGVKMRVKGGKSGLTYARDWEQDPGPIFLVEGGSDVAALLTMKLCAIGRPSNTGGTDLLIEMLETVSLGRPIVVVAERDLKPDGQWPGKKGAISTSSKLAQGLGREVQWTLPPDNCKDARDWLNCMRAKEIPDSSLPRLFLEGIQPNCVTPPPIFRAVESTAPAMSVDAWREKMLEARIASLDKPGYYLDCSSTGAGKSSVDLALLLYVRKTEAA